MNQPEPGCDWCDAYWETWATLCPAHDGTTLLTDEMKAALLEMSSYDPAEY